LATYRIELKPAAVRGLRKLPQDIQQRVARKIEALARNPRPAGVEKLKGLPDLYRLRVGDYRFLYQIQDKILLVLVVQIGHRREIYEKELG
jgi:mRNA interferase RelE/StbE